MTSSLAPAGLTALWRTDRETDDGCVILEARPYTPVDEPAQIVSDEAQYLNTMMTNAALIPLLFVVGLPGNVLSAAVFYRQGLRERINLCIFCLALADIVVITSSVVIAFEVVYQTFVSPDFHFFQIYFVGLTGFTWVSIFLSAVIAAERCFCVVSPLLAQRVLSTRTLAVIITCVSAVLMTGMLLIAGQKYTQICTFDPLTNRTGTAVELSDFFREHRNVLEPMDMFLYGIILPFSCFVLVLVTTIITAVKLRLAQRWRQQSSSAATSAGTGTLEKNMVAMTRMLIANSVLFIFCFTPIPITQLFLFFEPELREGPKYENLRNTLWELVSVFRSVNSALNFFVYFRMGSRFRQTLKEMFLCGKIQTGNSAKLENS
ncbi:hypothetical protein ACOMHN_049046 [Nucella lapillus]